MCTEQPEGLFPAEASGIKLACVIVELPCPPPPSTPSFTSPKPSNWLGRPDFQAAASSILDNVATCCTTSILAMPVKGWLDSKKIQCRPVREAKRLPGLLRPARNLQRNHVPEVHWAAPFRNSRLPFAICKSSQPLPAASLPQPVQKGHFSPGRRSKDVGLPAPAAAFAQPCSGLDGHCPGDPPKGLTKGPFPRRYLLGSTWAATMGLPQMDAQCSGGHATDAACLQATPCRPASGAHQGSAPVDPMPMVHKPIQAAAAEAIQGPAGLLDSGPAAGGSDSSSQVAGPSPQSAAPPTCNSTHSSLADWPGGYLSAHAGPPEAAAPAIPGSHAMTAEHTGSTLPEPCLPQPRTTCQAVHSKPGADDSLEVAHHQGRAGMVDALQTASTPIARNIVHMGHSQRLGVGTAASNKSIESVLPGSSNPSWQRHAVGTDLWLLRQLQSPAIRLRQPVRMYS